MRKYLIIFLLAVLAVFILSSCSRSKPQPINQLPPAEQTNPHFSQQDIDPSKVGTPTVVPADTSLEDYIKEYYEAYMAGDFARAYELLPAVNKARETSEAFAQSRSQMPITSYDIGLPVESQEGTVTVVRVPVNVDSAGMKFETTWVFEKQSDGSYILRETVTALNQ